MMTAEQYGRLPKTAKAIVDHDRETAAAVADPVVPLFVGHALRLRRQDRDYLTAVADKTWGNKAKNPAGKEL